MRNLLNLLTILMLIGCTTSSRLHEQNTVEDYNAMKEIGKFKTFNQTGPIVNNLDEISEEFLNSITENVMVLEIGAGFGYVAHKALEKGAEVYANEIDERHLEIIQKNAPSYKKNRLHLINSKFPFNISSVKLKVNSLDAVLAQRVLHFLKGSQLERGAKVIYDLLKPGGRVYVTVNSPYANNKKKLLPFLDENVLKMAFKKVGFRIEKLFYLDNSSAYYNEIASDGRERIGLIATKLKK